MPPSRPNQIATNAVTIDLNGFYVGGNCSLGSSEGIGIVTVGGRTSVTVLNEIVSCMGLYGIFLEGDSHRVERVTATLNGYGGIFVESDSIVKDNTANANSIGILVGAGVLVSGNTASRNATYGISAFHWSSINNKVVREWAIDLVG